MQPPNTGDCTIRVSMYCPLKLLQNKRINNYKYYNLRNSWSIYKSQWYGFKVNDSSETLLLCTHDYTMRQQLTSMVSTSSDSKEVRGTGSWVQQATMLNNWSAAPVRTFLHRTKHNNGQIIFSCTNILGTMFTIYAEHW